MKLPRITTILVATLFAFATANAERVSYSVEKIWGNGMHCAFTSIIKFKGNYFISFREGESHIFNSEGEADGKVRILRFRNGEKWEALPLIGKEGYDLRDPKLSITPDGRLMIIVGGSIYRNKKLEGREPQVIFSDDGYTFSKPQSVNIDERYRSGCDWLWRVAWHDGVGYSVCYGPTTAKGRSCALFSTTDGINFKHITTFDIQNFPIEATVRPLKDGRLAVMVRCDRGNRKCMWGVSCNADYTEWQWKNTGIFVGGPDFIVLDDGSVIAGGRTLFTAAKTSLFKVHKSGRFEHFMILPSGGDTSYPGFLVVGKELWVSYYSTHETDIASIYLAKIPLSVFRVRR